MCMYAFMYLISGNQLDQVIDSQHLGIPKHLGMIADSMFEWEGSIAAELKLSHADIAMIKAKHPANLRLQRYRIVRNFRRRKLANW